MKAFLVLNLSPVKLVHLSATACMLANARMATAKRISPESEQYLKDCEKQFQIALADIIMSDIDEKVN